MRIESSTIENAAKDLYIRALKILPDDIKRGFDRLRATRRLRPAKSVLDTMVEEHRGGGSAPTICFARIPASRSTTS